MSLIKTIKSGNATIEIYSNITQEEKKKNLIETYRIINKIADEEQKRGIKTNDWFYTQQELEDIEKSGNYILL